MKNLLIVIMETIIETFFRQGFILAVWGSYWLTIRFIDPIIKNMPTEVNLQTTLHQSLWFTGYG